MRRTIRPQSADGGVFSAARAEAGAGPERPRFDLRCTACGHAVAVSIEPEQCPTCHRAAWERRPREPDPPRSREESSASPAVLARRVIGSDAVRRWRFEQLQRAGYPIGDALVLSGRGDVDLHQATRLLRGRCALSTAVRILI